VLSALLEAVDVKEDANTPVASDSPRSRLWSAAKQPSLALLRLLRTRLYITHQLALFADITEGGRLWGKFVRVKHGFAQKLGIGRSLFTCAKVWP
jgi:hypothetical protein